MACSEHNRCDRAPRYSETYNVFGGTLSLTQSINQSATEMTEDMHERRPPSSSFSMFSAMRCLATMTRMLMTKMASGTSRKTSSSVVHDQIDQTCLATSGRMSQTPSAKCQKYAWTTWSRTTQHDRHATTMHARRVVQNFSRRNG